MLDILQARLGQDRVLHARPRADYRAEQANRWLAADSSAAQDIAKGMPPRLSGYSRPFWLLPVAERLDIDNDRPMYKHNSLRLILGPERPETGGWNANGQAPRDDLIAKHPLGARSGV